MGSECTAAGHEVSKKWLLPRVCKIVIKRFIDWVWFSQQRNGWILISKRPYFTLSLEMGNWTRVRNAFKKTSGRNAVMHKPWFSFGCKNLSIWCNCFTVKRKWKLDFWLINQLISRLWQRRAFRRAGKFCSCRFANLRNVYEGLNSFHASCLFYTPRKH